VGLVELLLHERRDEEPHTFEVLGIEDVVEDLEEVINRHELPFGDVAEIGACGEENRGGKLRQKMIRQIEVEIEPGQVALFLLLDFLDMKLREKHTALRMVRMRERKKASRPRILLAD